MKQTVPSVSLSASETSTVFKSTLPVATNLCGICGGSQSALLAMTLGCLEYTLEEGARWGWLDDNTILLTSVLALVSFILFAARTLTISNPIMDLHAFKDKNFTLGCFFLFLEGLGYSLLYI
nr:hypothetical protein [Escherichia coli]EGE6540881.1 hypothetical protein [Escherichia coli]